MTIDFNTITSNIAVLKYFVDVLNPQVVLRIHQDYLNNLNDISAFIRTDAGDVMLKNGAFVSVFVRNKVVVIELLDKVCRQ